MADMIELWAIIEDETIGKPNIVALTAIDKITMWPAVSTNKDVILKMFTILDERAKKNGARIVKFESVEE